MATLETVCFGICRFAHTGSQGFCGLRFHVLGICRICRGVSADGDFMEDIVAVRNNVSTSRRFNRLGNP
jgi:hypothetical protein